MTGAGEKVNRLRLIITESCLPQVLSSLEKLCRDEDKKLREIALKDLYNIGVGMNEKVMVEHFFPLIQRLVDDGHPSGRASACTLLNAPYHTLSKPLKTQMHSAYSKLCRDSEPSVRQEAATNLCRFAATVDSDCFEHDVMSLVQHFMADDDECVRSSAIESCGALQSLLDTHVFMAYILPVFDRGVKDSSLLVRRTVANQIHLICDGASVGILPAASAGILPAPSVGIPLAPSVGILPAASAAILPVASVGILPATSAGILPQMKEAKEAVSFQGALGIIGVSTVLCAGVYFGVTGSSLKEGVTAGLKELVGGLAKEIKTAREGWISKGCPALITVYPHVHLWEKK